MKKSFLTILFVVFLLRSFGQQTNSQNSIAEAIRINFNYDTLSSLACINAQSGIYALKFKIDRKKRLYDFEPLSDTLSILHSFFIDAIKKSFLEESSERYKKGQYIQLICFTNTLHCNPFRNKENVLTVVPRDTVSMDSFNYYKEIAGMLSDQLISLENSIIRMQLKKPGSYKFLYLPIALINNDNPAVDKNKPGFKNDIKNSILTNGQLNQLERQIEVKKTEKN